MRVLSFRNKAGVPTVSVGIAPNPSGLSTEEWVRLYPGWPGAAKNTMLGNVSGLIFEVNQVGDMVPAVYAAAVGYVFSISGNVNGAPDGAYGPGLTREEFDRAVREFRFAQ